MNTTSNQSNNFVPVTVAAARFGYRDAGHFRQAVAPRLGLRVYQHGKRWSVWQHELDAALARFAPAADSIGGRT